MDGCSMWGMYSRIIMPLSATVVASSIIFNMVFVWNDLNFPMILVDDPNLKSPQQRAALLPRPVFFPVYAAVRGRRVGFDPAGGGIPAAAEEIHGRYDGRKHQRLELHGGRK